MTTEEFQEKLLGELGAIRQLLETQNEMLEEIQSEVKHPDLDFGWDDTPRHGSGPTPREIGREIVKQLLILNKIPIPPEA